MKSFIKDIFDLTKDQLGILWDAEIKARIGENDDIFMGDINDYGDVYRIYEDINKTFTLDDLVRRPNKKLWISHKCIDYPVEEVIIEHNLTTGEKYVVLKGGIKNDE